MLRAAGVAVALMSLACGRSFQPDEADQGPASIDVGPPEVPPDDGPVIVDPVLEPLELERSEAGRRLSPLFWRLPDGSLRELYDFRWFDRELGVECLEVPAERNDSSRLRCMPSLAETNDSTVFADPSCRSLALSPLPDACTAPRYPTTFDPDGTIRVYRPTGELTTSLYGNANGCRLSREATSPWVRADQMPEAEMVGGEELFRAVSPFVVERTRRFDDGSMAIQRIPREPCVAIPGDEPVRWCVPAFFRLRGGVLDARFMLFTDPTCTEAVLAATPEDWEQITIRGESQSHALFLSESAFIVRPVLSGPEPAPSRLFQRARSGACQGIESLASSIVRLGEEVPISDFPRLRLVREGIGRLQQELLVDDDDVAWPELSTSVFVDVELGVDCRPTRTADETRCLPAGTRAELADGTPPGEVSPRPIFADAACTERVAEAPAGERFLFTRGDEEPCEQTRPAPFRLSGSVSRIQELGPPLPDDARLYFRLSRGECVEGQSTPEPGSSYRTLGDEVPPSTFAPLELVTD